MSCPGWRNPRAPPLGPRQRRCLCTPQGASRPLTRRRVFSGGLPPKKTLGGIVKDRGRLFFSVVQRKVFFHFTSERTSFAQPPHQLKVLGRWEVGVRGRREESPSSEGFPPSSPGTSRPPLSGCPALAPFGDDSPLLLAERQELVGQQRIGEGKVGTLMHTA